MVNNKRAGNAVSIMNRVNWHDRFRMIIYAFYRSHTEKNNCINIRFETPRERAVYKPIILLKRP